ncbi:MAG: GtrA family protein [Clostridiales bacterium]|nr:GtrA family protein [Clostridiales bacterium]
MFLAVGVVNTFAGTVFSIIYRSFIPDDTIAFIPGYITANVLSYILNSFITFKERLGFVKYIKFFISSLPNFIIQTVMVKLLSDMLHWPSVIVYCMAAIIGVPVTFVLVKLFAFGKKKK